MKKYNEELIILKVFTDCLVLVNRFTRKNMFSKNPTKWKNNNVSINYVFTRTDKKSQIVDYFLKNTYFFQSGRVYTPGDWFYEFLHFAECHYSWAYLIENTCPEPPILNCFVSKLTRSCCFFKNVKMYLIHGNVDKWFKNIAKLSKTKKKTQCFQTSAHVAPRRVIFVFKVYA